MNFKNFLLEHNSIFRILIFFLLFFHSVKGVYAEVVIEAPDSTENGKTIMVKTIIDKDTYINRDPEIRMVNLDNNEEITCYPAGPDTGEYYFNTPLTASRISFQVVEGDKIREGLKSVCDHPPTVIILQEKIVPLSSSVTSPVSCTLTKTVNASNENILKVVVDNWDCSKNAYLHLFGPKHTNETNLTFLGEKKTDVGRCNNHTLEDSFNFIRVEEPTMKEGVFQVIKGDYVLEVRENSFTDPLKATCKYNFSEGPDQVGSPLVTLAPIPNIREICNSIEHDRNQEDKIDLQPKPYRDCVYCVDKGNVWTAFGCIQTDVSGFVGSFFKVGLSLAGGIAFLFLIYGGFLVLTSAGNPETIQQGKQIITSAIAGLLLIIFSVLLLQLIAVDILKIPGFSR